MFQTNLIKCNLCESSESNVLFNAVDRLHGYDGTFTYVQCRICGLVFMNPQISPADTSKFYPDDYGPHQSNRTSHKSDISTARKSFRKKPFAKDILENLSSHKRLLDLGCGNGKFLSEAKLLTQCEVLGLDNSMLAAAIAKEKYGLEIFLGTICDLNLPDNYFDIVTAWSYIEHINDPCAVLTQVSTLLKNDGIFIIRTPNFSSLNARIFGEKWYHLDCPRHLFLYSPKTIRALLKKAGLLMRKITYDKSPKGILGSIQYLLYSNNYSKTHGDKIRRSRLLRSVTSPISMAAAWIEQSDVMTIYASKSS